MKNTKMLLVALAVPFGFQANAQVGINTETPYATLDVAASPADASKTDGFIAPKLTGDQLKAKDGNYSANQAGAIIYATAAVSAASAKTANVTSAGYYYFDGTLWQRLSIIPPSPNTYSATALSAQKNGNFTLIDLSTSDWNRLNMTGTDVTLGNASLFSNSVYTAPENGIYAIEFEIQLSGISAGLLGENKIGLLQNNALISEKNLDAVSISVDLGLVDLNVANVPVTSTTLYTMKILNAGDQLAFVMKNSGINAALLANSAAAINIYKINN